MASVDVSPTSGQREEKKEVIEEEEEEDEEEQAKQKKASKELRGTYGEVHSGVENKRTCNNNYCDCGVFQQRSRLSRNQSPKETRNAGRRLLQRSLSWSNS